MSTVILTNNILSENFYTQPYVTTLQEVPLDVERLAVIQHGNDNTLCLGEFTIHNNLDDMKDLKERFSNLKYLDVIACSMTSAWKNTFDNAPFEVRSSSGLVGHKKYGGDWLLDSHGVDTTDIYFKKNIVDMDICLPHTDFTTLPNYQPTTGPNGTVLRTDRVFPFPGTTGTGSEHDAFDALVGASDNPSNWTLAEAEAHAATHGYPLGDAKWRNWRPADFIEDAALPGGGSSATVPGYGLVHSNRRYQFNLLPYAADGTPHSISAAAVHDYNNWGLLLKPTSGWRYKDETYAPEHLAAAGVAVGGTTANLIDSFRLKLRVNKNGLWVYGPAIPGGGPIGHDPNVHWTITYDGWGGHTYLGGTINEAEQTLIVGGVAGRPEFDGLRPWAAAGETGTTRPIELKGLKWTQGSGHEGTQSFESAVLDAAASGWYGILFEPILNTFISHPADICFPAGTPVTTDQGSIAIEKLIPGTHTIKDQPIVGISQTRSTDNHLLCFEKHALGHNIPDQQTIMSREHCILYKGKMKRACTFMRYARIKKIKYTGETLYNVVLEKHSSMSVNNMVVETLHPKNFNKAFGKRFSKKIRGK